MRKLGRILALVIVMSMCIGMVLGLTGCGKKDDNTTDTNTYNVTVWVAENAVELTKQQIANFNNTNTDGITINATVSAVSESEAATNMITDVEAGADIFCFAQDQFVRLVNAGALTKLGIAATETVTANNDASSVAAVKTGDGSCYAYPLTADNGYFMYYDKSVISDSIVGSLEDIIAACKANGKNFSMQLESSAWYAASFFFGTGCVSEWTLTEDGSDFASYYDTFNSDKGLAAAKGMYKLLKSGILVDTTTVSVSDFAATTPSAVVISGAWDYTKAVEILGDNLGVAALPSFTVDGTTYHMGSFSGNKLLGVKPQTSPERAAALNKLALYLTSEQCQLERFNTLAWGPSNKNAQANEAVQANPALAALLAQAPYAIPQGQVHGSWWDIGKALPTAIKDSDGSDTGLKAALVDYENKIKELFKLTPEEKRAYTIIGSINGDTWQIDLPMTETSAGVWKTTEAYDLVVGDEFKARKGRSWDVSYGNGAGNYVVETAGRYYIQLTLTGDSGTIELIPAE